MLEMTYGEIPLPQKATWRGLEINLTHSQLDHLLEMVFEEVYAPTHIELTINDTYLVGLKLNEAASNSPVFECPARSTDGEPLRLSLVESIPNIDSLEKLESLILKNHLKLTSISQLNTLHLEQMVIRNCPSLTKFPEVTTLTVDTVVFNNLSNPQTELRYQLPKTIKHLDLVLPAVSSNSHSSPCKELDGLDDLNNLAYFPQLTWLKLLGAVSNSTCFKGVECTTSLEGVAIRDCDLTTLPDLSQLTELESFEFYCTSSTQSEPVKGFDKLGQLHNLKRLFFHPNSSSSVEDFSLNALRQLRHLKVLSLTSSSPFHVMDIMNKETLEELHIDQSEELNLLGIDQFPQLIELGFNYSPDLDIQPLSKIKQKIDIYMNNAYEEEERSPDHNSILKQLDASGHLLYLV